MIPDPYAEARRHAANAKDFYDAYIAEGFTPDQAMALLLALLSGMLSR